MKQNNPCYLFGMYEADTDSVIINAINDTYTGTPLTISCEKCNSVSSYGMPSFSNVVLLIMITAFLITLQNIKHML